MQKIFTCSLLLLLFVVELFGQQTFRRDYGLPYAYGNERAHRIECLTNNGVVIGFSDSPVTNQRELTMWAFDYVTGQALDSLVLPGYADNRPVPDGGFIINSYPTATGGFLLMTQTSPNSAGFFDRRVTEFDADLNTVWTAQYDLSTHDHRAYTLAANGDLLCLQVERFATGNIPLYRLVRLNQDGTETILFSLAELGPTYDLWGLDAMPNGDVLITGGDNGSSYLSRYTLAGGQVATFSNQLFPGAFPSERLSAAQLLSDNQTIMATGGPFAGNGRSFITVQASTLAPVWDTIHTGVFANYRQDQVGWYADGFYVENYSRSNFNSSAISTVVKFADNGYSPRIVEQSGGGNGGPSAGHYHRPLNTLYTTVNDLSTIGDDDFDLIGFLPQTFAANEFTVRYGSRGYSSQETAAQLLPPNQNGQLGLLHTGALDSADLIHQLLLIDPDLGGLEASSFALSNNTAVAGWSGGLLLPNGNYVFVYREFSGAYKIVATDQAGNQIWENTYPEINGFNLRRGLPLASLSDGSLLLTDNPYNLDLFDFTTVVAKLDGSGNLVDSIQFTSFYLGLAEELLTDDQDNIYVTGPTTASTGTGVRKLSGALDTEWETDLTGQTLGVALIADGLYFLVVEENGDLRIKQLDPDNGSPVTSTGAITNTAFPSSGSMTATADDQLLWASTVRTETEYKIVLRSFDPTTFSSQLLNEFPMQTDFMELMDVLVLADGRIAIYGTIQAGFEGSTDHFLILTDANGQVSSVTGGLALPGKVTLYPQPSFGPLNLRINVPGAGEHLLRIYDANGRVLQARQLNLPASSDYELRLATDQWPAGNYYLRLSDTRGRMSTQKLIIH